jgi:hypothetical protein
MTSVPYPPSFRMFRRLKMKLKGRYVNTIEVIEAESRPVLRGHKFQDEFKNGRSFGNGAYVRKGVSDGGHYAKS